MAPKVVTEANMVKMRNLDEDAIQASHAWPAFWPALAPRAAACDVADTAERAERRRTCITASTKTRSTRTSGRFSSPSIRSACCRSTPPTCWSGALASLRPSGLAKAGLPCCDGLAAAHSSCLCILAGRRGRYHENGALNQAPHTYAIADNAYRNLIRDWKVGSPGQSSVQ